MLHDLPSVPANDIYGFAKPPPPPQGINSIEEYDAYEEQLAARILDTVTQRQPFIGHIPLEASASQSESNNAARSRNTGPTAVNRSMTGWTSWGELQQTLCGSQYRQNSFGCQHQNCGRTSLFWQVQKPKSSESLPFAPAMMRRPEILGC